MSGTSHDRRQRRLFFAVAAMFFVPLFMAFYLYYGHGSFRALGSVNHGELIEPPRPLPELKLPLFGSGSTAPTFLLHKWTLMYVGPGVCGERCRAALYETRQVRAALDRDTDRVQRLFIASGACCDARFLRDEHPDLITVRATAAAAPLLAQLPRIGHVAPLEAGRVYLIDPSGNLMMSYASDAKPKGMLEDLKRLLQLSQIG
ncbi:MAG TPA: hypothetical protein VMV25_05865 [Steroidobacteraceae bacterium]|nr:hypothetical protein [Steroidobacteraceae bacterium]